MANAANPTITVEARVNGKLQGTTPAALLQAALADPAIQATLAKLASNAEPGTLGSQLPSAGGIKVSDFIPVVRGSGNASEMLAATGADLLTLMTQQASIGKKGA